MRHLKEGEIAARLRLETFTSPWPTRPAVTGVSAYPPPIPRRALASGPLNPGRRPRQIKGNSFWDLGSPHLTHSASYQLMGRLHLGQRQRPASSLTHS